MSTNPIWTTHCDSALPELAAKVRELEALLAHTTCGRAMAVELSSRIHAENAALDAVRRAEKAEAVLARVDALHQQPYCSLDYPQGYCAECDHAWPCPTIRAFKEAP